MNCKPGDLAVNIGGDINIGAVVEVVRRYSYQVDWEWVVNYKGKHYVGADRHLRPIRDPGDDATDETLTWLPVPSRESETA